MLSRFLGLLTVGAVLGGIPYTTLHFHHKWPTPIQPQHQPTLPPLYEVEWVRYNQELLPLKINGVSYWDDLHTIYWMGPTQWYDRDIRVFMRYYEGLQKVSLL